MANSKRVANNILDLLIDPTRIPYKERVYTREEENIQNSSYEKAKADACQAFKAQKHNSDFYPHRNRSLINREATIMDRKTLIASLDVLSKNFKNPSDPIAADLSVMAQALSKMSDDELTPRLASEAPDLETVLGGKKCDACGEMEADCTCASKEAGKSGFKCPKCSKGAIEGMGKCQSCGATWDKPAKEASEEVEAGDPGSMSWSPASRGDWRSSIDPKNYKSKPTQVKEEAYAIFEKKVPEFAEKVKVLQPKTPDDKIKAIGDFVKERKPTDMAVKKVVEEVVSKCASTDFWTKEAADVVARALVSEIVGVVANDDEDDDDKPAVAPAPAAKDAPAPKDAAKDDKKDDKPAKKEDAPAAIDVPAAAPVVTEVPAPVQAKEEEKKDPIVPPEPKEAVVDTGILASVTFAGIEVPTGIMSMDDVGEMSDQEKANLAQLF